MIVCSAPFNTSNSSPSTSIFITEGGLNPFLSTRSVEGAVYNKMGQLDNYNRDESLGNMLKLTCSTGATNFQKPAQPSQPNLVTSLAAALLH